MNRPHFRRRGRAWREQTNLMDPNPEYSRLDHLDGLPGRTRYDAEWPDVIAAEAGLALGRALDEWSSLPPVFAPHTFVGGDLAAMAAPGDWPLGDYGEGYEIGPWPGVEFEYTARYVTAATLAADWPIDVPMVRAAATAYDLGLPVPLRSDPPIYRACLAGHVGAGVRA